MSRLTDDPATATLEQFMAAWNAHDVDALMSFMTDDCVFYASAGTGPDGTTSRGPEQVREAYAQLLATFPDARWSDASHAVAGDRGLSQWTFSATMADGRRIATRGCDLFLLRGGKIAVKDSFRKNVDPS